jgi:hypothetical protein
LHDDELVLPAARKTVDGLQEMMRLGLEGEETRLILPVKPPRLVKVTLVVAEEPVAKTTDDGLAPMEKSTMLMVTLTLCETEPLVPTTVTI